MNMPPIVSPQEWQAAREELLVKEKENWEDSPEGVPQTDPYGWWNRHDEYDA